MRTLNKYNYITGEIIASYGSIKEAAISNNMTYARIYKSLQQTMIKYPRCDFYISDKPKPRWVIVCYDNENRLELGRYKNIQDAAVATGVDFQQIQWQIARDLDFNTRRMGCTGLWFKRITII